jgi:hypothetical protein
MSSLPSPAETIAAVQEALALLQRQGLDKALSGTTLVTLMTIAHCDPADHPVGDHPVSDHPVSEPGAPPA